MENENAFQVMTEDEFGTPVIQNWYESREDADTEMADCKRFWPNENWWIEEGIDHINEKCRGCGTIHCEERSDAYGIFTGHYCDGCYENNYPYHKGRYDYQGAGEKLENDY